MTPDASTAQHFTIRPRRRRIPADEHVVFNDNRESARRLEHAANLRGRAEMHAAANLRARADERMRIDERALADPGADVDVHRRHADHAAPEVGAISPVDPPGTTRTAL